MDSWSYLSETSKGLFSTDEMDSPVDAFSRGRKPFLGFDQKPSFGLDENGLISDRGAFESMEFMNMSFPDAARKPFHAGGGDFDYGRKAASSCLVMSNLSFRDEECGSTISSSFVESSSQNSSSVDLKLGRVTDYFPNSSQHDKFKEDEKWVVSSVYPALPTKRGRATNSFAQVPLCQVYGCNKDLSSSKEYHKRHKVCEVHSKTAKVIVNGVEQRFCQQCSRFHLLGEFDDGKRSCRRRLAGHNARRRKPQLHGLSVKLQKLPCINQATRFPGTSVRKAPFLLSDAFHGGMQYADGHEEANIRRNENFKLKPICSSLSAISTPHIAAKGCTGSSEQSSLQGCALSLLSAEPHDLSSHVSGFQNLRPSFTYTSHVHQNVIGLTSENQFQLSALKNHTPNGFFCSSAMKTMDIGQMESFAASSSHSLGSNLCGDASFQTVQESDFLSRKFCLSPERGSTVDLIQLSSHLQRVERQRSSVRVKQEDNDLSYFLNTSV